jgi:hypothetical protein
MPTKSYAKGRRNTTRRRESEEQKSLWRAAREEGTALLIYLGAPVLVLVISTAICARLFIR